MNVITPPPQTYTYIEYTVTTITASPIPSLAETITLAVAGESNGTKTTTSEVLTCTPTCMKKDSDGDCLQIEGCEWSNVEPSGFVKQGQNSTSTKTSGALNLWRNPGARMAMAVLGMSWVAGMAMLKVF